MVIEDVSDSRGSKSSRAPKTAKAGRPLEQRLASPIDRAAAFVADMVVFLPIAAVAIAPFRRASLEAQVLGQEEAWIMSVGYAAVSAIAVFLVYQAFFIAAFSATPGMMALKLRAVSLFGEGKPKPIDALLRGLVWVFEAMLLGAPWLAAYTNDKRRTMHDRVSDTIVISLDEKRQVGLPTIPEASMASGFQAAALAVLGLVAGVELAHQSGTASTDRLAQKMEDEGYLCADVREALEDWPSNPKSEERRKGRLATALSLHAAEALDPECLKTEADFAIWRGEEKDLAYLAKGLAEALSDEKLSDSYLDKVCEIGAKSEACQTATVVRASLADVDPAESAEEKSEQAESQNAVEEIVDGVGSGQNEYLKVWVARYLMGKREYGRAIQILELLPPQRKIGEYTSRERAKALWRLGQKSEARLAMRSSFDLMETGARVELARWFCYNETAEDGCSGETATSCGLLSEAVERGERWLSSPEVAAAYVRGASCSANADKDTWTEVKEKLPSGEAKKYVEALSLLESPSAGEHEEGLKLLKKMASGSEGEGQFYVEANVRLTELAAGVDELEQIRTKWLALDEGEDSWWVLGRQLIGRLNTLKAWDKALAVGLRMTESDRFDRQVYRSMVIAAYRSGQSRMALGFLENLAKLDQPIMSRQPASIDEFEDVAKTLLGEKRGEP